MSALFIISCKLTADSANYKILWPLAKLDLCLEPPGFHENCSILTKVRSLRGLEGFADLKISKSALPSSNDHNFSNTEPIYTKKLYGSFVKFLLNYLAFEMKDNMVDLLPW